jgi:hypothetical protein
MERMFFSPMLICYSHIITPNGLVRVVVNIKVWVTCNDAFIYTFNLYICVISESVVTMRILREIYFLLYITGSRLQEVIKKLYGRRYMLKYVLSLNLYTFMTNNTKHISFVLSVQMHVKHTFWWNNVNSRSTKYNKVIFLYLNCHYRCLIHYRSLRPWY